MSGKMVQVCQVCERREDLRYGVCFDCADFVKSDGVTAYDIRHPYNRWMVTGEPKRLFVVSGFRNRKKR